MPSAEDDVVQHPRQARNLSVVEIHLADPGAVLQFYIEIPELLEAWKANIIDVLENSLSKNRKFLKYGLVVAAMCAIV